MEYSNRIDEQIAELLSTRNRLTPAHLPGIPDEDGAALLQRYAELHGAEEHVSWDGTRLVRDRPAQLVPEAPAPVSPPEATGGHAQPDGSQRKASPVDEILAAPQDKSLLDSAPAGAVPKWIWLLPLMLALPGGLVAWLLVRDTNRVIARVMLITGILVTVLSILAGSAFQGIAERMGSIIDQSR